MRSLYDVKRRDRRQDDQDYSRKEMKDDDQHESSDSMRRNEEIQVPSAIYERGCWDMDYCTQYYLLI